MSTRFQQLLVAIVLTIATVFTGCRTAEKKQQMPEVSIRLKWLNQAQFAGFYYAKEDGLYEQQGVNVVLRSGGVDYPAIQMVASGSDQFGVTGADQILLAREKGIPVVAIAAIYRQTPFVLFSLKKSGITRIEQFVGRKIGVKLGGNEELTYRAMMGTAKLKNTQVKEIPVKFDISPLLTGQVDVWPGYSINEPIAAQEQGYDVNLISPSDYNLRLYADVLFTTEETIRTKPEIVKGVVRATIEGWTRALQNKEKAITYTLKYGPQLTHDHEMKMLTTSEPFIRPDDKQLGYMDLPTWTKLQELLLSLHFMTKQVDLQQAYRVDFLSGARP